MTFAIDSRKLHRCGSDRAVVELPTGWTAPRTFGGMAMACALRVGDLDGAALTAPLSASATFHRPLCPGPVDTHFTELARTRRTRGILVRLGDQLTLSATLVGLPELAGGRRDAPAVPAPEALRPVARPGRGPGAALARRVDWRAITPWTDRRDGGEVLAWLAPRRVPWITGGHLDPLWYCVAADLLGPALYAGTPFTVATVSLDLQIYGLTRSPWLLQRVIPDAAGPWAGGRVELFDQAGRLVATATQRARLLDAKPEDEPWSVTAFGSGRARLLYQECN
jgi:hypothetical protein